MSLPFMDLLTQYAPFLLKGAGATLKLGVTSFALSLIVGMVWTVVRLYAPPFFAKTADASALFFRGMPELLIILAVYYLHGPLLQAISGGYWDQLSPFASGVLALSLCYGAYASEVMRYAVVTIPNHQIEAAEAFALPPNRRFIRIILPQATFRSIKGLTNLFLSLIKDTALLSVISVPELVRVTHLTISSAKHPFTFYMATAFLYLLLTSMVLILMKLLDHFYFYRFHEEARS